MAPTSTPTHCVHKTLYKTFMVSKYNELLTLLSREANDDFTWEGPRGTVCFHHALNINMTDLEMRDREDRLMEGDAKSLLFLKCNR